MTENEFLALARAGYNRIPLHLETLADLDTPLSIYLKLANRPNSYLLESVINPNAVIVEGPGYTGVDGRSIMPSYADRLTVPVADNAALDRAAQCAVRHGRLGAGSRNAPLPFI